MNIETVEKIKKSYSELLNLKLVAESLDIPWQTVYWWLKKEGVSVTGDKSRYGSNTDKVGLIGESLFHKSCMFAIDQNKLQFQAGCDFIVGNTKIDVKTSFVRSYAKGYTRWGFNPHKTNPTDYLVCYCLEGNEKSYSTKHILLIPFELLNGKQTLSVSTKSSKYLDFKVTEEELVEFFVKISKE